MQAATILQDRPGIPGSLSAPPPQTLSAYVQPVVGRYLDRFEASLGEDGFTGAFSVMQSNGGRMPAAAMAENAITALFSGPAAGVVGAVRQAARSGFKNFITLDVGGTSTDVCLAPDGRPAPGPRDRD